MVPSGRRDLQYVPSAGRDISSALAYASGYHRIGPMPLSLRHLFRPRIKILIVERHQFYGLDPSLLG